MMPMVGGSATAGTPGWMARQPAVAAALLMIAGIVLHRSLPALPWVWASAIALLLILAIAFRRKSIPATACLAVALLISGIALAQLRGFRYPPTDIAHHATDEPRLVQVEMLIEYPPRILAREFDARRTPPPKQVFTATVTRIHHWDGWRPVKGSMLVALDQPHPRLAVRQRIIATGLLQRPSPAMNPGQFDWARYYRDQRIAASLQIRSAGNVQVVASPPQTLLDRLRRGARAALAAGFTPQQSLDHALMRALLLGDSDPELRDVQEQFARTGTSHHLAISGLHIAVLGGFVFGICRLLALSPRKTAWIGGSFVAIYGLAALPSAPVVRSVLLCLFIGTGLLSRRSLNLVHLLAISALLMLIYHPLDLYSAGFQLSFGTVLGLMVLTQPTVEWLGGDAQAGMVLPPATRRQAAWLWIRQQSRLTIAAALVAWLVSLPLVAYHFERLNPWAMVGSIVLAPVVFVALILGLVKVVATLLLPSAAGTWAVLCAWPMTLMRWMVDALAALPGSDVPFTQPPVAMLMIYYVLLVAMIVWGRRWVRGWQRGRLMPLAAACLLIVCIPMLMGARARPVAGSLRMTVLAIGAGSCNVVELPDKRVILLDAGSLSLTDPVGRCIEPFLRHRGIRRIDAIYLSHCNYDHFSAVIDLLDRYDVREVWISPEFVEHAVGNPPAEKLLARLQDLDLPPRLMHAGQMHERSGARIEALWPPADATISSSNDASMVLRVRYAGRSILVPGDIQATAQRRLMDSGADLRSDVLIAPHHGSFEAPAGAFLAAVAPMAVISSNDRTLTVRQKDYAQIVHVPLLRTHEHGSVTIELQPDGTVVLQPFHGAPLTYRR